jgi:hypothetical protein
MTFDRMGSDLAQTQVRNTGLIISSDYPIKRNTEVAYSSAHGSAP